MLEDVKEKVGFDRRVARLILRRLRGIAREQKRGGAAPDDLPSLDDMLAQVRERVDGRIARLLEQREGS